MKYEIEVTKVETYIQTVVIEIDDYTLSKINDRFDFYRTVEKYAYKGLDNSKWEFLKSENDFGILDGQEGI